MRFVIVLGLVCCCYATQQITSTPKQEDRLPPQHIKQFIEQHIQYVEQQMHLIRQQIKEGKIIEEKVKPKVNSQQLPENIKKFIESHITKVLLHFFVQQKQQKNTQVANNSSKDVVQNVEALKEDIKNIIEQAETHIPQVINQQIDFKNQIREKQGNENRESAVISHSVKSRAVAGNIQKSRNDEKEIGNQDMQNNIQVITQHADKTLALLLPKEADKHGSKNTSTVETQYLVEVQRREEPIQPNINQHTTNFENVKTKKIKIPLDIQSVEVLSQNIIPVTQKEGHQIHQHIPQVMSHKTSEEKKTDGIGTKLEFNYNQKVDQNPPLAFSQKVAHAKEQIIQNVTKLHLQGNALIDTKNFEKQTNAHENVGDIIGEIHHIPQEIDNKVTLIDDKPKVQPNFQGVMSKSYQQLPRVIGENDVLVTEKSSHFKVPELVSHVGSEKDVHGKEIKGNILTPHIVEQPHQLVPKVIEKHHDLVNKKENQVIPKLPEHIQNIVEQINHHAPVVIKKNHEAKPTDIESNAEIHGRIQSIVKQIHQHIPQTIENQVILVDEKSNQEQPEKVTLAEEKSNQEQTKVPEHIQDIVEQVHQHIPQLINKTNSIDKRSSLDPEHIQSTVKENHQHQGIMKQVDQHFPNVVDEHKAPGLIQQRITQAVEHHVALGNEKSSLEQTIVPERIHDIVKQINQHVPQVIDELKKPNQIKDNLDISAVTEHFQNSIQQIHQHIPEVISHQFAHIQNESTGYDVPSNIEGVVQQINLQIPQVLNHNEDHVAQEQSYYIEPNQNVPYLQYFVPQVSTVTANIQSGVYNEEQIRPVVVQTVSNPAHYDIEKTTNILPSRVQQVQTQYHISPVRRT